MITRALLPALALLCVACQATPDVEGDAFIAFSQDIGDLIATHQLADPLPPDLTDQALRERCEDLGRGLNEHLDRALTEAIAARLRQFTVAPRRYDDATEDALEQTWRAYARAHQRCQRQPQFRAAAARLERAQQTL